MKNTTVAYYLQSADVEKIKKVAQRFGLSDSSALRLIIREWDEFKRAGVEVLPHPADGEPVPVIYTQEGQ